VDNYQACVSENDWRRHNSEMEPQEEELILRFTAETNQTLRLGKTTLRVRVHVQTVGLNAEAKTAGIEPRGDFSLDIPYIGLFRNYLIVRLNVQTTQD